jgi:hypothetical protein
MSNWFDVVEDYVSNDAMRNHLHRAIRTSLGEDFAPDLIHPIEEPSGMLLMFTGDEPFLIRFFDPPPTATIIFLGSLAGAVYSETVTKTETGHIVVVDGELAHERLGGHSPLRIRYAVESDLGKEVGALDRSRLLREKLLKWSREPQRTSPQPR